MLADQTVLSSLRRHWGKAVVVFAVLVAAVRAGIEINHSIVGGRVVQVAWWEAAQRSIGIIPRQITDERLLDQARYWLDEVESMPNAQDDPQLAAGAAWLLHKPCAIASQQVADSPSQESDHDVLPRIVRVQSFEDFYGLHCQKLIDRAIALDPDNKDLHRTKAQLVFPPLFEFPVRPRHADWEEILDECAVHDADNALYDYLAAAEFIQQTGELYWTSQTDEERISIVLKETASNPALFDPARKRIESGLNKPFLKIGVPPISGQLAILDHSNLNPLFHKTWIENHEQAKVFILVKMFCFAGGNFALQESDFDVAETKFRVGLRIADQLPDDGNIVEVVHLRNALRIESCQKILQIQNLSGNALSQATIVETQQLLTAAKLDDKVYKRVHDRLEPQRSFSFGIWALTVCSLIIIVKLLVISVVSFVIGLFIGRRLPTLPVERYWIVTCISWGAGIFASCAIAGSLWESPFQIKVVKVILNSQRGLDEDVGAVGWALQNWTDHYGVWMMAGVAAACLLLSTLLILADTHRLRIETILAQHKRQTGRIWFRMLASSSAMCALLALFVHLLLLPHICGLLDRYYEESVTVYSDQAAVWNKYHAIEADIRSDEKLMDQLRKNVISQE